MTKGFKSTEFWMAMATMGVATFLAHSGADVATIAAVVVPSGTYIGSRGLAKHGTDK